MRSLCRSLCRVIRGRYRWDGVAGWMGWRRNVVLVICDVEIVVISHLYI